MQDFEENDGFEIQWRSARGPKGGRSLLPSPHLRRSRNGNLSRSATPRSPFERSFRRLNDSKDFKKGAAAAALESESEESGYGETYGETMQASSFDTHLDEPSYWMGSEAAQETQQVFYESDDESGASYVTGVFPLIDPSSLRDATSQTPGYAKIQTIDVPPSTNRSVHSQTMVSPRNAALQTSSTSLHSIGAQTQRQKSGSRSDLLRSILLEVKDLKRQQGIDGSDVESLASDSTIRKETLETLYRDVYALRNAGARGTIATQTLSEQTTQTAMRMFPEGDPVHQARQERLQGMLAEIKHLKGDIDGNATPSQAQSTPQSIIESEQRTTSRSLARTTPARFESPHPIASPSPTTNGIHCAPVNGYDRVHFAHPPETYSLPVNQPLLPLGMGRRRVTQEDLNAISERLDRLQNYQMPSRRQLPVLPMQPPPPPPPPQPLPVVYIPPPHRPPHPNLYRIREFARSYDDMDALLEQNESGGRHRSRHSGRGNVMDRYHLDDALEEANNAARELKRMSSKMKRSLREELSKY